MATEHSSNATSVPQMSTAELSALATRLRNRADNVVLRHQPEQQRDLRQAAYVLDELVKLHSEITADPAASAIQGILKLVWSR